MMASSSYKQLKSKSLAEFEFQNHDFGLIEEAKDDLYVRIERECRTAPFPGMKQPTPVGGILGHEVVLTIKHFGERVDKYRWELVLDDVAVANGVTDAKGEVRLEQDKISQETIR